MRCDAIYGGRSGDDGNVWLMMDDCGRSLGKQKQMFISASTIRSTRPGGASAEP